MRPMRLFNKTFALFIVTLFVVSFSLAGNSAAVPQNFLQSNTEPRNLTNPNPVSYSLPAEEGTSVDWFTDTGNYNDSWSWQNNNWLFGPQAGYELYYQNSSLIERNEFIPLNEEITFTVKVPENMLRGADLQNVDVSAYFSTSDSDFDSGLYFSYYAGPPDSWYGSSYAYNTTSDFEQLPPYLDLNIPACNSFTDGTMHYVVFKMTFNTSTPVGLYNFNVNVYDSDNNYYDLYSPWSNDYGYYEYALGIPRSQAMTKSFDGGYTIEKFDINGDILYSATRGMDYIYRFNISGNGDLAYALYSFSSMYSIPMPINASGTHFETVVHEGGWVYDPLLQTYYYNDTIQYEIQEDVLGDYYNYDSIYYPQSNYTYRTAYPDYNTSVWEVHTYNSSQTMQVYYIYNFTSNAFDVVYGFYYQTYPSDTYLGEGVEDIMEWYTEPIENAPYAIYDLNTTLCTNNSIDGTIILEFAGHFTDLAPEVEVLTIYECVFDENGWLYNVLVGDTGDTPMTSEELTMVRDIAVESPVTLVNLKNADDSDVYGYFFPAEQSEPFKVEASLQGGSDIADEIDGAVMHLSSYSSFWTDTEWGSSNLYYEISIETDGTTSFQAYNVTYKENQTYGLHMEYTDVLLTGWHSEYNATLGADDWVYGDYYEGRYIEVEGLYWEWFYFNQQSGEWMSQEDWYSLGMNSDRSEFTRVTDDFAAISDIAQYTLDGNFFFEFLLNFTEAVPDSSFWWNFQFANLDWSQDDTANSGYYEVATWSSEWVYSFDYLGKKVHADVSVEIGVANSTISDDWMKVREDPYITIDDVHYPIMVRELINSDEEYIVFNDLKGDYYELLNGSKIYITGEQSVWIYNVSIAGHETFLSTQKSADWWYDGLNYYSSWWDIYGNVHQGTDSNVWDYDANVTLAHISDYIETGLYVRVGTSARLDVVDYPRNDPRTGSFYIVDFDGNRYDIQTIDYNDYIFYDGSLQSVSYWPQSSFEATYLGSPVFVPGYFALQEQWFTVDGHDEMPYPGANADWSGVNDTTTNNPYDGKVPTSKTVFINGEPYLVGGDPELEGWYPWDDSNHTGFWVTYNSKNYNLDGRRMYHVDVNGTEIWNPETQGATFWYGDNLGTRIIAENYLTVSDTYFINSWNNGTHDLYYVTLENGTTFSCEPRYLVEVYLMDVEGELVYTRSNQVQSEMIDDYSVWFVEDLNGTRHYVADYTYYLPIVDAIIEPSWEIRDNETSTFYYIVNGTEYSTFDYPWPQYYMFTNGTDLTGKYFDPSASAPWPLGDQASLMFEFLYNGSLVNATAQLDYIFKVGLDYGYEQIYGLNPIESVSMKNFYEIIVGNPEWALWGVKTWSIDSETGALDLDGDLSTTYDQYYVLEEYQSIDSHSSEWSRMWVDLFWDPSGTIYGDEMHTYSWMGIETYSWTSQWQQTYYWYHADDMTQVSSTEMLTIQSTLTNPDGSATPGYWDISHMAKNVTWEDILAEAAANGWDWISQEEQTWTWLSFGFGQDYGIESATGYDSINLRYEYSGLMLWDDADNNTIMNAFLENPGDGELTHYFIPDSVGSVSFVTPGDSYGVSGETGHLLLEVVDEVAWGVTFHDVNGTTFPFNAYAYWDWYGGVVTGSDLRTFDERPTKVSIDEISFLVHFQGTINTTEGAISNYATIKVDNTIGQWDVDMVGGMANLAGKSLALNYLADVSTSQFRVEDTEVLQEETIVSDRFSIGNTTRFAEMIMGGVTYEWAYDPYSAYNVTSQTTRASTFTSAYESDSGVSATSWSFSSTQYYVSIGFPYWDGYYVYQDPVFVGYISSTGSSGSESDVQFDSLSVYPEVPSSTDSVSIGVDVLTTLDVWKVDLVYSTDGYNFDRQTSMYMDYDNHWTGSIEPFEENTQVWYKVVVETSSGTYESEVQSYIVGQGSVVITTTPGPTDPTSSTTPTGGFTGIGEGFSMEVLMMIGGIGIVVIMLGVLAKRRK